MSSLYVVAMLVRVWVFVCKGIRPQRVDDIVYTCRILRWLVRKMVQSIAQILILCLHTKTHYPWALLSLVVQSETGSRSAKMFDGTYEGVCFAKVIGFASAQWDTQIMPWFPSGIGVVGASSCAQMLQASNKQIVLTNNFCNFVAICYNVKSCG